MGTDKNADVLWVGNSWGGSLSPDRHPDAGDHLRPAARSDRRCSPITWRSTRTTRCGATCGPTTRSPEYDPASGKWTIFDLPVRGTEIRHISLDERDGRTQVIVPVYRTNQMGVMTVRSEAELAALKAQAQR